MPGIGGRKLIDRRPGPLERTGWKAIHRAGQRQRVSPLMVYAISNEANSPHGFGVRLIADSLWPISANGRGTVRDPVLLYALIERDGPVQGLKKGKYSGGRVRSRGCILETLHRQAKTKDHCAEWHPNCFIGHSFRIAWASASASFSPSRSAALRLFNRQLFARRAILGPTLCLSISPHGQGKAPPERGLFLRAAEGIRTLDLLRFPNRSMPPSE
jgi:hypothetical protein